MSSKSKLSYGDRAKLHRHPVVKKLFTVAEAKKSNVIISADMRTTAELLALADQLGPYIAVFKTHIDLISDFSDATIIGLKALAEKHNFMFFEDRKFIDIGHTVQQQYHGGALKISEFAHVVNASVLAGEGIIEALEQTIHATDFPYQEERAVIILAEMTTAGSLAKGKYTQSCIDIARKHKKSVIGFVATQSLTNFGLLEEHGLEAEDQPNANNTYQSRIHHLVAAAALPRTPDEWEDFVIFTTGINSEDKGDDLGQQYQTPTAAVTRGSDFVIAGRGIYGAPDPVEAVKRYREDAWDAYLIRTNQMNFDE